MTASAITCWKRSFIYIPNYALKSEIIYDSVSHWSLPSRPVNPAYWWVYAVSIDELDSVSKELSHASTIQFFCLFCLFVECSPSTRIQHPHATLEHKLSAGRCQSSPLCLVNLMRYTSVRAILSLVMLLWLLLFTFDLDLT